MLNSESIDYSGLEELYLMESAVNYNNWLFELSLPYIKNDVLEIGSGIGTFTKKWNNIVKEVCAIEMADNCLRVLNERFRTNENVQIVNRPIEEFDPNIYGFYHTAISFNVFEHIENDVAGFKVIYNSLNKNSNFILFVPAFQKIYGEVDKNVGHIRRYEKVDLLEKLNFVGFKHIKIRYVNMVGYFAWKYKSQKNNSLSKKDILIYDKLVIPIIKNFEKFFSPPFGQSIFVIATKI